MTDLLKKWGATMGKSCWDCIHCDVCANIDGFSRHVSDVSKCKHFKDKADVEPVKRGYIVTKPRVIGGFVNHKCPNPQCKHEWQTDERVKTLEALCSECGKVLAHNYQNYCPYCGAKFDGRKCRNDTE